MRRWLALLLLATPAAAQTIPILTIADADSPVHRILSPGQLFVKLPAVAGDGFAWRLAPAEGVEATSEPLVGQPPGGPMVVGGPQIVTFHLRLTSPGARVLRFSYARGSVVARVATFAFPVR